MTNDSGIIYNSRPKMFGASPIRFVFLWMLVFFGVALIPILPNGMGLFGLVPSAIGLLALGAWYLGTLANTLTVDERHIHHRQGILSKKVKELAIRKVRAVEVSQSFVQRMTKVGKVLIYSTGDLPEITLAGLPNPELIQDAIKSSDDFEG